MKNVNSKTNVIAGTLIVFILLAFALVIVYPESKESIVEITVAVIGLATVAANYYVGKL